jgi:hypothetical protein
MELELTRGQLGKLPKKGEEGKQNGTGALSLVEGGFLIKEANRKKNKGKEGGQN